jgi:hypothetical protein
MVLFSDSVVAKRKKPYILVMDFEKFFNLYNTETMPFKKIEKHTTEQNLPCSPV